MAWRVWLVLVLSAGSVRAQLLDLDAGAAPEAGTGKAALRLADTIEDGPGDAGRADAAGACAASFRRLAVALLRSGEDAGRDGSYRVLVGRTIARRLGTIDARLGEELNEIGAAGLARVAEELDALADDVPENDDELDRRLRDVLAPLLLDDPLDTRAGWWCAAADPPPLPISDWVRMALVNDDTAGALRTFDAMLGAALRQPGYTRSAAAIRRALTGAVVSVSGLPSWVGERPHVALLGACDEAVRALIASSGHVRTAGAIEHASRVVRGVDELDEREGRTARGALLRALEDYSRTTDAGVFGTAEAVLGALGGLVEPEDGAVRALRPATRGLSPRVRDVRAQLVDLLGKALSGDVAATDPALVGVLAVRREMGLGLGAVGRLEAELSPRGDGRDEWRGRVAESLLPLTRRVGEETDRDAALDELALAALLDDRDAVRALADILDAPGEYETAWDHLCDGRRAALAGMLRRAADTWDGAWADPRSASPPEELNERLRQLGRHAGLVGDFFTIRTIVGLSEHSEGGSALERWPGWELSAGALRRLALPLEERMNQATAALLDGDGELHRRLLQLVERDAGLVRLVAELERGARAAGQPQEVEVDPFMELGLGAPTPGAWRGDLRGDLASVCRYAEEWAEAERIEDRERAAQFAEYVRAQAGRVVGALEREQRRVRGLCQI